MRKILLVGLFLGIIAVIVDSCTTLHSGNYSSGVVVSEGTYSYKRKVVFETHYAYALGFGGNHEGFLMDRLKEELYARAELADEEELINITVSNNAKFFLVFGRVKVRITGDVIEWGSDKFESRNNSKEFQSSLESLKRIQSPKKQLSHLHEVNSNKDNLEFIPFENGDYPQIGEVVFYPYKKVLATVVSTTFNKYKINYFKGDGSQDDLKAVWLYKNQIQKITEKNSFKIKE